MRPALGVLLVAERRLDEAEAQARAEIARPDGAFGRVRPSRLATLDRLEASVGPATAVLSYSLHDERENRSLRFGGCWVPVRTRSGTRAYRLAGRVEIESALKLFEGLIDRADDAAIHPATALHDMLLAPAPEDLPAEVTRLVIIPDGLLHRPAFGVLRPSADEPPLAARYEIQAASSATAWLQWRDRKRAGRAVPLLAIADPDLPDGISPGPGSGENPAAAMRSWSFAEMSRLGPLPHARMEARAIVGRLRGGSRILQGAGATERAVKEARLTEFSVLHVAAHALVDDREPRRSGILLAHGADAEDGLLQIREIVDLDLDGKVVVLAACRSAGGAIYSGEGAMGLSRAFFVAGARTVVGSLWPLRDDAAAAFFARFQEHLGGGLSVAAALAATRRHFIEAGAPPSAWAGVVALGDGDAVPFPGGRPFVSAAGRVLAVAAGSLLLVGAALLASRRRRAGAGASS